MGQKKRAVIRDSIQVVGQVVGQQKYDTDSYLVGYSYYYS